jgi:hypothetical protein
MTVAKATGNDPNTADCGAVSYQLRQRGGTPNFGRTERGDSREPEQGNLCGICGG